MQNKNNINKLQMIDKIYENNGKQNESNDELEWLKAMSIMKYASIRYLYIYAMAKTFNNHLGHSKIVKKKMS